MAERIRPTKAWFLIIPGGHIGFAIGHTRLDCMEETLRSAGYEYTRENVRDLWKREYGANGYRVVRLAISEPKS